MRLVSVVYDLFDFEVELLASHDLLDWHEIDREIRLIDENGKSTYVSWTEKPVHHAIGVGDIPFFCQPPPATVGMSTSPVWASLIGSRIEWRFLDDENQVLQIQGADSAVYCSSQSNGNWYADVVRVSSRNPGRPS